MLTIVLQQFLTLLIQAALGEQVVAGHEKLRHFLTRSQHHLHIVIVGGLAQKG